MLSQATGDSSPTLLQTNYSISDSSDSIADSNTDMGAPNGSSVNAASTLDILSNQSTPAAGIHVLHSSSVKLEADLDPVD